MTLFFPLSGGVWGGMGFAGVGVCFLFVTPAPTRKPHTTPRLKATS